MDRAYSVHNVSLLYFSFLSSWQAIVHGWKVIDPKEVAEPSLASDVETSDCEWIVPTPFTMCPCYL